MKLMIIFEGLGLGFGLFSPLFSSSYVANYLAKPLGVKYEQRGWMNTTLPCRPNSFAVGHSYGGVAALAYAERCKVPAVILDDRPPIFASCTSSTKQKVTAFYREGMMRGCPVKGAVNVKLPSSVSHIAVPAQPAVHLKVRELMK